MSQNNKIPGPGKRMTLREAADLQRDTLGYLMQTVQTHGDVVQVPIGPWKVTLLSHPDAVKHVLLDNWKNFSRDTFQFRQFARVTGDGLLNLSGDVWQTHRRLTQPGFHRKKLAGMAEGIRSAVARMANRWRSELAGQESIELDLDAELLRLAYEVIGQSLFSIDVTSDSAERSQELLALMEYVIYRSQNLVAPPTWVPTGRNLRFKHRLDRLDRFVEALVHDRRRGSAEYDDLLDLFLGTDLDDRAIRDEIVTMIIAGYETVATGMGWLMTLVAQHPAEADQVRQAILAHDQSEAFSYDLLSKVPELDRFIQEGFRLYPPSWLITRKTLEADTIGGYEIPAGQLVVISPYAVHRHPDFWAEPERFDPDRFIGKSATELGFSYIPFGGGPHLCIGRPLALLEAGLTLAITLPEFDFRLAGAPPKVDPQVTLRPKPNLLMNISQRS